MAVHDTQEAVLARIDGERLVRLALDLLRFNTDNPPGNEAEIAAFLAKHLRGLGMETEIQEVQPGRANVLGRLGAAGARPHLILNGHTDTVPAGGGWTRDPRGEVADGRLYGRGSSDMKGGIAAMLAAVEAIVRSGARLNGSI